MFKAKIHKLAREAVSKLRGDGIEPTLDEIVWLHSLAKKTEEVVDPALLLFSHKKVGNISISPMTIGARIWLLNTALKWFEGDDDMTDYAILYAHAHSRCPESLNFESPKEARRDIIKWARKCNVTNDELTEAFKEIVPEEQDLSARPILDDLVDQIKSNPHSLNLSKAMKYLHKDSEVTDKEKAWAIPYIALLTHYYPGKTESEWLWDTAEDISFAMIKQAVEMEKCDDDKKIDPSDPSLIAFTVFRKAIAFIRGSHGK